jgi:phage-related holin
MFYVLDYFSTLHATVIHISCDYLIIVHNLKDSFIFYYVVNFLIVVPENKFTITIKVPTYVH